tara:strand:- start:66 stop:314 length:249 start_codon:yes stop_codon:yes gene_type:complete
MVNPTAEDLLDETVEPEFYLTALDRCDTCNAQAYYLVGFLVGELLFCRHHYLKNETKLVKESFKVIDESARLYPAREVEDHA